MKIIERIRNTKTPVKVVGLILIGWIIGGWTAPMCSNRSHSALKLDIEKLKTETEDKDKQIEILSNKVKQAQPFFEMKKEEQEKIAQEQQEKEEQKKKEEEARKEEELKKGYDTGITYDQLARTPDDYLYKKVKFSGKVLQVMESGKTIQIRLAVDGDYDKIILAEYTSDKVKSRVLENDNITIMGLSEGLFSYKSTLGKEITIPGMVVDKVIQ